MGWTLRQFFKLWVRAAVQPAEAPPSLTAPEKPVCYVFDRDSMADLAVLCNVTERRKLPYPEKRSSSLPVEERRSYFDVGRRRRFWDASITRRPPPYLLDLVEELRGCSSKDDGVRDVLLVPTAVYWGRAPQKEGSWLRLLFAEEREALDALDRVQVAPARTGFFRVVVKDDRKYEPFARGAGHIAR
jgi:glycerol-3-phosphate O-acyltransferase